MTEPPRDVSGRLKDLAKRAQANLEFVEQYVDSHPDTTKAFEVTQLLASLLWLIVAVDQYLEPSHETTDGLREKGWPTLRFEGPTPPQKTVGALTHFLRNAIAHVNVELIGDGHRITRVRLWNIEGGKASGLHTADLELSVADLRRLA